MRWIAVPEPRRPKIPESVLVVIHTPALDVLLIERADHPGYWQSVTGSLDRPDEPLDLTARREVLEETGIDDDRAGGTTQQGARRNVGDPRDQQKREEDRGEAAQQG